VHNYNIKKSGTITGKAAILEPQIQTNIWVAWTQPNKYSDYFICNCGVRQGESLSPIFFANFLNDLEDYLDSRANSGVVIDSFDDNLFQFIKNISVTLCRRHDIKFG